MIGTTKIYVVYDSVAEESGMIFESNNNETAKRSLKKQIKEDKEDFKLVWLGTFDHKTMKLSICETPTEITLFEEKDYAQDDGR